MFVAIVTAPGCPASATISPSRWANSGLALSTVCGMPRLLELAGRGARRPRRRSCRRGPAGPSRGAPAISRATAAHLPPLVLKTWSLRSARTIGRFVGICDDRQLVDLHELVGLGEGRAGHARELVVHAEVVLQRDRGERLVLLLDPDALLRLDRLVQALRPAPAVEDAAGELVDDLHLAVDDRVVDVALVQRLGLQRLVEVVDERAVLGLVEVVDAEEALGLLDAAARSPRPSCASRRTRSRSRRRTPSSSSGPCPPGACPAS